MAKILVNAIPHTSTVLQLFQKSLDAIQGQLADAKSKLDGMDNLNNPSVLYNPYKNQEFNALRTLVDVLEKQEADALRRLDIIRSHDAERISVRLELDDLE